MADQAFSAATCPQCGTRLPALALACPNCQRLVHAEQLQNISEEARQAAARDDRSEELRLWRSALDLLPQDSRQYIAIEQRVVELSRVVDANPPKAEHRAPKWIKALGPLAPILLILWKFKVVILAVLSKGKLLIFGLSKVSTFSTMLLSIGAYWTIFGWWFAVGLVLSIYVHEMGHVYALRQFGFAASAPTFIPFLGAFVRMKQHPISPFEDARVGLAGPIWGTVAAIGLFIAYNITEAGVLGAIAHFAAWLNLFNLIPVWQLDGARGMRALTRTQRAILLAVMVAMFAVTREGFLIILAGLTGWRLMTKDWPDEGDPKALVQFCGLIVVLAILMAIPVPEAAGRR
ncbi:MAG TPA: site-2 protease family protein [Bryobacteraceae bacterium]|nr:site-2 protease family protein [Bryobacteraceae bacterium]